MVRDSKTHRVVPSLEHPYEKFDPKFKIADVNPSKLARNRQKYQNFT